MAQTTRPPIIAVMGHIDHGKSSLLDYVRKTSVVDSEAGGITQHVSAYIARHNDRDVTFLDTPGHEAFKALRARGAAAADIAILVVSADEGVMPQTLGALGAIKNTGIPFIVAITKIDKNNADIERTKRSLIENGILIEGMGGDIAYAPISSKTGEGINELLDLVLLIADMENITADPSASASGFVLEATQDSKRGVSATLIMKDGSLERGVFVVAGDTYAPIRFIEDFQGKRIDQAKPSEPIRISGFNKLPPAGTLFSVVKKKKEAEVIASKNKPDTVTQRYDKTEGDTVKLILIVKTDVAGSIDAIVHELSKITNENADICIISSGVGNVSETDVKTACASGGTIIAFNVGTDSVACECALREKIKILPFSVIYELSEKISDMLDKSVANIATEKELGRAKVLKSFSSSAKKQVLGARHISGTLRTGDRVRLMRAEEEISQGNITNLQQSRVDTKEIKSECDFGIEITAKEPAIYNDEIVAFSVTEV